VETALEYVDKTCELESEMDRATYALNVGIVMFLAYAVSHGVSQPGTESGAALAYAVGFICTAVALIAVSIPRAKDAGLAPWTTGLLLIPFVGFIALLAYLLTPSRAAVLAKREAAVAVQEAEIERNKQLAAREAALKEREARLAEREASVKSA